MNDLIAALGKMIPGRKQAKLPMGMANAEHSIATMDIGEKGWTVPWAMYYDKDRNLWLNGSYTIHADPGGTARMAVWRDEDGWCVDASGCRDHHWSEAGYVGEFQPVSVVSFIC